ncbi:hypothetical protein PsorP6_003160 [Peronosclerospora sorghi]|uniref:Uncharacterized protein n=1 Tax=Peronosclerospora sorghi TaxID=230839 RepID=A0ACC0VMD4_9STRA|nr:hypothetical protein PsorP6_003160 [Peronosclerospora sorghi]
MLVRTATERNVRSILFHVKPTSTTLFQGPDVGKAIRALKAHGYLLGWIGDASTSDATLLREFHLVYNDKDSSTASSMYAAASKEWNVPLDRTLLVTESTRPDDETNDAIPVTLTSESMDTASHPLVQFVKDLLDFDACLDPTGRCFGPFRISFSQVFYESTLSFALVNLKPIVRGASVAGMSRVPLMPLNYSVVSTELGHVLVVPKRRVARFTMLDVDEVSDLWTSALVPLVLRETASIHPAGTDTFPLMLVLLARGQTT